MEREKTLGQLLDVMEESMYGRIALVKVFSALFYIFHLAILPRRSCRKWEDVRNIAKEREDFTAGPELFRYIEKLEEKWTVSVGQAGSCLIFLRSTSTTVLTS